MVSNHLWKLHHINVINVSTLKPLSKYLGNHIKSDYNQMECCPKVIKVNVFKLYEEASSYKSSIGLNPQVSKYSLCVENE